MRRRPSGPWFSILFGLGFAGCAVGEAPVPDVSEEASSIDVSEHDVPVSDVVQLLDAGHPIDVPATDACTMCGATCVDLSHDPYHCGACTTDCTTLPHVRMTATCTAGTCDLATACHPGFGNCDGDAANGCETDLSSTAHCGACATACAEPTPVCTAPAASDAGAGTDAGTPMNVCASGCATSTATRCAMSCVETATDPAHCGTCTNACASGAHSMPTCAGGLCGLTCMPGFADCDHVAANGCESDSMNDPMNCGACGMACPVPANGTANCMAGSCGVTCNAGYHLCGGLPCTMTACSGSMSFTTPGMASFTVPAGVTMVSVVVVGGGGSGQTGTVNSGGGGGGALCYANNIAVTPGTVIPIVVGAGGTAGTAGGASVFNGTLRAGGGGGTTTATGAAGGAGSGGTCFVGGIGGSFSGTGSPYHAGAGGAAGYGGNGGRGSGASGSACVNNAAAGVGGGGGGGGGGCDTANCGLGYGGGGGGVELNGQGANGAAGGSSCSCGGWGSPGQGGSGGMAASGTGGASGSGGAGGNYGGGGGSAGGGGGGVRVIWGTGRTFPLNAM